MPEVWVGRQPIFDRKLSTHAYELLFRSPKGLAPTLVPGASATAQVIMATLADLGLTRVVGQHLAFVNLTRGYITGQYPLPLPPERVVLEILEDIHVDREVILGVERLKAEGFSIALDDFSEVRPALVPLLRLADIVKVECLGRTTDDLSRIVESLKKFDVELLAEKIETEAELDAYRELDFDYYQGFFLERPTIVKSTALEPQRIHLLRLVAEVQSPDGSLERVEEIVRQDLALSFKLLACVNSANFSLARHIDTVREALIFLGEGSVRNLVCLLLLARVDDKPVELVTLAMTRAKMCENLARAMRLAEMRTAFVVGMFSLLDALLDQPLEKIIEGLPLTASTSAAIVRREGELGRLLSAVIAYEHGLWGEVEALIGDSVHLRDAYLSAVQWVASIQGELDPERITA